MQETNVRFYVVCDTSASMSYRGEAAWGSKLECARVLAAALTWFLLKQNDAAGMVSLSTKPPDPLSPSEKGKVGVKGAAFSLSPSDGERAGVRGASVPEFIRPSQRPNQFGLMLRHLELLRASGGPCLSRLLQHAVRLVHRRSVILFFSDLLEPSAEVALG